jgi:phosphoribosylglycinamide formyltransferase 1
MMMKSFIMGHYNMRKIMVAVLISGNGSNLQALIDACASPDYPAEIALVISNKDNAYGLVRAKNAGIATCVISHSDYSVRADFDAAMHQKLLDTNIEIVCLAGFMRLLTPTFVEEWQGRMLNIHPSLLPAYKGLDTHARVLATGETHTGATVHYVVAEMDAGEIILQQQIAITPDDDASSLQQKVHQLEHIIYPQALKMVAFKHI